MATALISDLHLGTTSGADVARLPEVRERLCAALAQADHVVLLGDVLELRELPAAEVLAHASATLRAIGSATAGRRLTLVPGNHDHALVAGALDGVRLAGAPLETAAELAVGESALARRIAELMPDTDVRLSYPGVRVRDDVYATHGHYLDVHLTVPRLECLALGLLARVGGSTGDPRSVAAYEDAVTPLYAFAEAMAQGAGTRAVTRGGHLSRSVWRSANGEQGGRASALVGRLGLPTAVAAVNALGLGRFRADISGLELRRSGLRAIAQVIDGLGIEAEHVIFGHTHRAGPLVGETEGWWPRTRTRLTNTGSWLYEPVFVADGDQHGPYWPGRVTWVGDSGAPEQERLLDGIAF